MARRDAYAAHDSRPATRPAHLTQSQKGPWLAASDWAGAWSRALRKPLQSPPRESNWPRRPRPWRAWGARPA